MKKIFLSIALLGASITFVAQNLPDLHVATFDEPEGNTAFDWLATDGGEINFVADPFDATNMVMRYVRKLGGQIWDGPLKNTKREAGTGQWDIVNSVLADTVIHISRDKTKGYQYFVMRLLTYTGGEIVVKPERGAGTLGNNNPQYSSEQLPQVGPSRKGKWQTFIFDLTDKTKSRNGTDLAALDAVASGFNALVIQPDRSSGGNQDTTFIDDMYFTNNPPIIPVNEQVVGDFKSLAMPGMMRLTWSAMQAASQYIIYLNGEVLETISDSRINFFELSTADFNLQAGADYIFEIEAEDSDGNKTDGKAKRVTRIMRTAEDASWAMIDDFETPTTWTLWQKGIVETIDNPVKNADNNSEKVFKFVRNTPCNGKLYGEPGRDGNSNSFATAKQDGQRAAYLAGSIDKDEYEIGYYYAQIQVYRPITEGNVVLKLKGTNLTPLYDYAVTQKDSVVRKNAAGADIKEYVYRNMCTPNAWKTYVFKFPDAWVPTTPNATWELVVDNLFDEITADRTYYVDNLLVSRTAEPVDVSTRVSTILRSDFKMFALGGMIAYELPVAGIYSLEIFDMAGKNVATLFKGRSLSIGFDKIAIPTILSKGIYMARLSSAGGTQTIKLVIQ